MATKIIVSYDGTNNEDDALALGRLFAAAGGEVELAYVSHGYSDGSLGTGPAGDLLARGAESYGDPEVPRHVVENPSTPAGLRELAGRIQADVVVFCSDSHTSPGRVSIGNSARNLLEGGPVAVAIAPAGLAGRSDFAPSVIAAIGDSAPAGTAASLARALGADVAGGTLGDADLLVIGSRPEAAAGSVSISAAAESLVDGASCPVLVLPAGVELQFAAAAATSA